LNLFLLTVPLESHPWTASIQIALVLAVACQLLLCTSGRTSVAQTRFSATDRCEVPLIFLGG